MSEKDTAVEVKADEIAETESVKECETVTADGEADKAEPEAAENQSDEKIAENIQRNLPIYYASLGALVAILALILVMIITVVAFPKNETVEAGEAPNFSYITQNKFWGDLCEVVTDVAAIDTSTVGVKTATLRFFGFIDVKSRINVVDTIPPEITFCNVVATDDVTLDARMFVSHESDATGIAYTMSGADDVIGGYAVTICGTDGGGNSVTGEALLEIVDAGDRFVFEYGVTEEEISAAMSDLFEREITADTSSVDGCGEFTVTARGEGIAYCALVVIKDTAAPVADVRSFDLVLGETLDEDDIVGEIFDHSEVKISFGKMPDFGKSGEYSVSVTLTDTAGNSAEYISTVRIHDICTEITADVLSTNDELAELIFNDAWSREMLQFDTERVIEGMTVGENSITLCGEYGDITVTMNGVDTAPPELRLKDIYRLVGVDIVPEDFVLLCTDASEVSYSFAGKPDSDKEGRFMVTVSAADSYGNETVAYANVHYYIDRTMPTVHGLSDIIAVVGDTPLYFKNVYATDDTTADVSLSVNTDEVEFDSPGVYPITYIAVDESGNETRETVLLRLIERIHVELDVENILQNPRLPNGCEVVSLAIALGYEGFEIDPVKLFEDHMQSSPFDSDGDPWTTYIGDPRGYGLGCYAPCVVAAGNDYLAEMGSSLKVSDVSGLPLADYEKYIDEGTPVIMWGLLNMNGSDNIHRAWYADGEPVVWHSNSHCLVLIGYTNYTYIFCDPLRGVVEYSREAVEKSFDINFRQACVITGADE